MRPNGRRFFRQLILAITGIVWLAFVWFLLPTLEVTREIKIALHDPAVELSSPDRLPTLSAKLLSLSIPPRTADAGQLRIQSSDSESTVEVAVGETVAIGGTEYVVTAIRPWAGLVHRPPGLSMLNVAVRSRGAEWIENVFVERGGSRIVTPEIAVLVGDGDKGIVASPARWGVVEDGRTHWFSSFVPGTGLELADGGVVTLLARQPSGRILVEIAADGARSEMWVEANRYQPGGQIWYEDPGAVAYHIEIDSDERGRSTMSIVEGDLVGWTRLVEIGSILVDEESGVSVRIDQDERDALALFAEESPWLEVVLSNPGHVLRIREGEAVRVGESTVTFEALANPQPASAQIMIGGTVVPFAEDTVYAHDDRRFGGMRVLSPTEVALVVNSTEDYGVLRVGLTGLFFVAALAIFNVVRRRA